MREGGKPMRAAPVTDALTDALTDRATRTVYATDNSIYQVEPEGVYVPSSAAHVAEIVAANNRRQTPRSIVARGGGTGTNGQSLTDGFSVDLKRHLHRIGEVVADGEKVTVTVEPGVVTGELNRNLRPHGMYWAPHTSTVSRATVGGMISTDAAGKGSLVHGRAHRHVISLEVVLDDGSLWVAEPLVRQDAEQRASGSGRGAEIWAGLLAIADGLPENLGLPELGRGFSGYGIDRLNRDGLIDPVALLCGAEGTLAIIVSATLRLTPVPDVTRLVVSSYPSFDSALRDAIRLRDTGPAAIECFDEATLAAGRGSPAWRALDDAVGDGSAVLLLEYADGAAADDEEIQRRIAAGGRSVGTSIIDDPAEQAMAWKVRSDAVALLAKVVSGGPDLVARPTAFVEDCAVPVEAMPEFIAGFRSILDAAGLEYAMFGHADVGCVHVRPALDLRSPDHRALVADLTAEVSELVASHGGILWGEHGRGFRGANVDQVLAPETLEVMRDIKALFDPNDLFNPGKLYRPTGSPTPLVTVREPPLRGMSDSTVPVELRRHLDSAFACNGNGLCQQHSADDLMCPSYVATRDPALSPKGRADLLRSWAAQSSPDREFEDAIAANLGQCLSCSACSGQCPVEVDIPELKSRFLERYYKARARPLSHQLLARFEMLAVTAARQPSLMGLGARLSGPLLGLVDLPTPSRSPRGAPRKFPQDDDQPDIVVLPDVFTSVLEPDTQDAAVRVLEALGYHVAVAKFVPSGKFDHVKGNRKRFEKAASAVASQVREVLAADAVPVVIEPAVRLLHDHEYPEIHADFPGGRAQSLAEVISARIDRWPTAGDSSTSEIEAALLLGHCTERALDPAGAARWATILRAAGVEVETPAVGCCGMAGIFGHEATNRELSERIWNRSWARAVSDKPVAAIAPGYSCRSQARRFGGTSMEHPIHALDRLLTRTER